MNTKKQNQRFLYQHLYYKFDIEMTKVAFKSCVKSLDDFDITKQEKKCFDTAVNKMRQFEPFIDTLVNI